VSLETDQDILAAFAESRAMPVSYSSSSIAHWPSTGDISGLDACVIFITWRAELACSLRSLAYSNKYIIRFLTNHITCNRPHRTLDLSFLLPPFPQLLRADGYKNRTSVPYFAAVVASDNFFDSKSGRLPLGYSGLGYLPTLQPLLLAFR
jgi:hypothetical protein